MENNYQKKYEASVLTSLLLGMSLILIIMGCYVYYQQQKEKTDKNYKVNVEYLGLNSLIYSYDCDSVSKGYAYKDGVKIQLQPESKITFK
jgi:hypothetical protein